MHDDLCATVASPSQYQDATVNRASESCVWSTLTQFLRFCPLTAIVVALTLSARSSSSLTAAFELNRGGDFGVLQILGCHLLHWSGEHLFWDLGMFTILGIACERSHRGLYAVTIIACALGIPLAVLIVNPAVESYRGLSGIDTGLFSLLVASRLVGAIQQKEKTSVLAFASLLILLGCKIVFEFHSGQVLFVQSVDFVPVPIAHAAGALLGAILSLLFSEPYTHDRVANRDSRGCC